MLYISCDDIHSANGVQLSAEWDKTALISLDYFLYLIKNKQRLFFSQDELEARTSMECNTNNVQV